MPAPGADLPISRTADAWLRRRLVRALLYGSSVDRRPRRAPASGSPSLVFAIGYAVIAARLDHVRDRARRATPDAARTAARRGLHRAARHPRPQWRDPGDRRAHAVAVRRAAPDHRCRRSDRSCSPPSCPMLDAAELRERLAPKRRFVWLKREITPQAASSRSIGSAFPASASCARTSASIPMAPWSRISSATSISTIRASPASRNGSTARGLADLHMAGLAGDRLHKPVELAVDLRVQHAMRDELVAARDKFKAIAAAGLLTDVRTGEIISMVSVPGLRSQQSARGARSRPASTASPPACSRWARPSRRSPWRWRSTPARSR